MATAVSQSAQQQQVPCVANATCCAKGIALLWSWRTRLCAEWAHNGPLGSWRYVLFPGSHDLFGTPRAQF